jgi:hypothetical protein
MGKNPPRDDSGNFATSKWKIPKFILNHSYIKFDSNEGDAVHKPVASFASMLVGAMQST